MMIILISTAIAAFVLTAIGVGLLRKWIVARGILDVPNARSSHSIPTPRGGGLVIAFVLLAFYIALAWPLNYSISAGYVAGAALVVAISWVDDIRSLPFFVRLAVHFVAAWLTVYFSGGFNVFILPFTGTEIVLGPIGSVLAVVWIVWMINAYNFMDGIDGIAGVQAVAAGVGWLVLGISLGASPIVVVGSLVAAASSGFLVHNWPPAKIFMGDAGSAFLGFTLAAMPLLSDRALKAGLIVPAIIFLWPFVWDSLFTLLRRLTRRERFWQAHRSHLYQRLVIAGWSHTLTSMFYSIVAFATVGLYFFSVPVTIGAAIAFAVGSLVIVWSAERNTQTAANA